MKLKRRSKLVLDEMITGSYHLSALEGLSLGKPVLTYIDRRTEKVLKFISGADDLPFVNIRLEELELAAKSLLNDVSARNMIGVNSRKWIETYWKDKKLAFNFKKIYEDLLENPERITRQKVSSLTDSKDIYFSVEVPNIIWENRKLIEVNRNKLIDEKRKLVDENRKFVDENRKFVDEKRKFVEKNRTLI